MRLENILEQVEERDYFEDKNRRTRSSAAMSNQPSKKSHSDKNCVCGGHSANDGDRQYKGRQWEKHT